MGSSSYESTAAVVSGYAKASAVLNVSYQTKLPNQSDSNAALNPACRLFEPDSSVRLGA